MRQRPSFGQIISEAERDLAHSPTYVLFVLLVPLAETSEAGRYQSGPFETHLELSQFMSSFREFFESEGGHHVWIGSTENEGLVIYDQHNVLFAYGPIEKYERRLLERGFREESFWFPAPHMHRYSRENQPEEVRLLAAEEWVRFPLQPGDEWE